MMINLFVTGFTLGVCAYIVYILHRDNEEITKQLKTLEHLIRKINKDEY